MLHIFSFITSHFSFLVRDSRSGMIVLQGSQIPFQFIEAHHCHPLGFSYSLQHLFHCIKYILLQLPGMRRFWHYLLPHGRCYLLQHLFHCITEHFARASRHEKVLALFITSWPMLFIATFISLHKVHLLEFPGMRSFWHYLLPHDRSFSLQRLFHCIKYILLEFPGMRRFLHYLLPHGRCYSLPHLFHCIKYILLEFPGMRRF